MNTELVEISLPLHTHFNKPDRNGRIFSEDSFKGFINGESYQEALKNGGFPITTVSTKPNNSMEEFLSVDHDEVVGSIQHIDMESKTAHCRFFNPPPGILENVALGVRAIATVDVDEKGTAKCDIHKIVSFDLINCKDNPCE